MDRVLGLLADALIVVVAVVVLGVIGIRYTSFLGTPTDFRTPGAQAVGERLDSVTVGIDFGAGAKTLVMALDSDCVFCQQSMPFYRRLLEADRADTQIVVATSPDDRAIIDYLATERVNPDTVVFVEPGTLPVPGTPTLLLVDDQGLITHAWVGLLDDYREAEVISSIFG